MKARYVEKDSDKKVKLQIKKTIRAKNTTNSSRYLKSYQIGQMILNLKKNCIFFGKVAQSPRDE